MQLQMYGVTDIGLVRTSNQDSFYFNADYGIAIVSDGMGGHKGGEIASQMVVSGLKEKYLESNQILLENVGSFLDETLKKINSNIFTKSSLDPNLTGMGATVNYLQFASGSVAIGHSGDSRTYLVRSCNNGAGQLSLLMWQLTIDHNVGTFIERGLILVDRPVSSRQKAQLTCGMGVLRDFKSDMYFRNLMDGDVLLTCSDGLHGYVSDYEILAEFGKGSLEEVPARLVHLVKKSGAPDNVTIVVSLVSDFQEPLCIPNEAHLSSSHIFLVRTPDHQCIGPYSVEKLTQKIVGGEISLESEISASLTPWVFLNKPEELFRAFPMLQVKPLKEHLSLFNVNSALGPEPVPEKQVHAPTQNGKIKFLLIFVIVVLVLGIIIFIILKSK